MSDVLPPSVRTFKMRRSRITERQQAALESAATWRLDVDADLATIWDMPFVVEIGFGTGEATAAMASAQPDLGIVAIDVHTPGIGGLLALVEEQSLTNVRVIEGDALEVLEHAAPQSIAGVRSYFPDPWPKARHHKRRLVQPRTVDFMSTRLQRGGFWHIATDWPPYADEIDEVFTQHGRWSGGRIDRPDWRPVTRFERRGINEGRPIADFMFVLD